MGYLSVRTCGIALLLLVAGCPPDKTVADGAVGGAGGAGVKRDGGATDAGTNSRRDASMSGGCQIGGCSNELCSDASKGPLVSPCIYRAEFACYKSAECARQADGTCGWTMTAQLKQCLASDGGGSGTGGSDAGAGKLRWYMSCGAPVCSADPKPYDDPSIPNCTTQKLGDPCTTAGERCDGVASCGATLICAQSAPRMCPISRARFKRDISYLTDSELNRYHEELMSMPLASYRYKDAPEVPQLGFVIDDVEPSVAVAGDHVNMYGYLSMAVAAIKVQQKQIETLQRELEQLRADGAGESPASACMP